MNIEILLTMFFAFLFFIIIFVIQGLGGAGLGISLKKVDLNIKMFCFCIMTVGAFLSIKNIEIGKGLVLFGIIFLLITGAFGEET